MKETDKMKKIYCLALIVAVLAAAFYYGGRYFFKVPTLAKHNFVAMNTYVEISAHGGMQAQALPLAEQRIHQLEGLFSVTDSNSEISAINNGNGRSVRVSPDTEQVLRYALAVARDTDGAFDPTIYPLLHIWGFTTDQKRVPDQEALDRCLPLVDYTKVSLRGNALLLPAGMQLDLGGIGKGYAGDAALTVLKEHGVTSALVNLGGNVQTLGRKPDGSLWKIAVKAPESDNHLGVLQIENKAVVTSGSYIRYFKGSDGRRYGHILDPHTGKPVRGDLLSVTVVGEQGALCDALATAFFVMGREQAEAFWRQLAGVELMLITKSREIYLTEGLAGRWVSQPEFADWPLKVIHR